MTSIFTKHTTNERIKYMWVLPYLNLIALTDMQTPQIPFWALALKKSDSSLIANLQPVGIIASLFHYIVPNLPTLIADENS